MKAFAIALAIAAFFPAPVDTPPSVVRASSAPVVQREAQPAEPSTWLLALTGALAIALMRRPYR